MMKKFFSASYLVLLLVMLYAPIVIIAIYSFTESKVLGNWTGFSTELYTSLFTGGVNNSLIDAIKNTFIIAFVAATVSTLLGTIAISTFAIAELLTMNNIKLFGTTIQENINNGMWEYGAALSFIMLIIIGITSLFTDSSDENAANEGLL